MTEEKEVPEHIKEFYDRDKKVGIILNTTKAEHSAAYLSASDILKDEKGDIINDKLKDKETRKKFLDKLIDHYLTSIAEKEGIDIPKDEFGQDIILSQYLKITRGEFKRFIDTNKENYTQDLHEKLRDEVIKKQTQELMLLRHGHLEKDNLDDILNYTGVADYIDKERIQIDHAVSLLDYFKDEGQISLPKLRELTIKSQDKGGWGSDVYLTEKGKEKIKELKEVTP